MPSQDVGRSRVLIIEDSKADQELLRRGLRAFDLTFAESGEEGLLLIEAEPFDLILLDYQLPGINGAQVLGLIRSGAGAEVPVVVVSGAGSETIAVELLKGGAADYITKGELASGRVADAVQAALDRRAAEANRKRNEAELRLRKEELERSFRQLQENQGRLIQSEKMAGMGQLVAGVAHEINNPLAYVTNNIAVLNRDVRQVVALMASYRAYLGAAVPPEIRAVEAEIDLDYTLANVERLFRSTRQGLQRVGEIVAGLRDFSRLDEAEFKQVDPNEPVRMTVEMIRYQVRQKEIQLDVEIEPLPTVWCNPGRLNQVLLNLLVNAIQAVDPGATIAVRTRHLPDSGEFQYEVADTGPGIPEAIRDKIFDPFFTTKPQGVGTGLGLWIAYSIVQEHHGRLQLSTETGRGTTFTVTLPILQPEEPSERSSPRPPAASGASDRPRSTAPSA